MTCKITLEKSKIVLIFITVMLISCNKPSANVQKTNEQTTGEDTLQSESNKILASPQSAMQNAIFKWSDAMCNYTGTYNPIKYTKEQLANTVKFLIQGEGTSKSVLISEPNDVNRYKRADLERKFDQNITKLKSLSFVSTPLLDKIKQKRIAELERMKLLTLMEIDGYINAEVLLNDKFSKEDCAEYSNALIAGGEVLLLLRQKMALASKTEGNTYAWEAYLSETKTNNELQLARVHVCTFGWWNCVNKSIVRVEEEYNLNTIFVELFEKVSFECEEP